MSESFLNGKITLHCGDMLAVLPTLAENSIDSCVTDPPYHLTSIIKRFGGENAAPAKSNGATGIYRRALVAQPQMSGGGQEDIRRLRRRTIGPIGLKW